MVRATGRSRFGRLAATTAAVAFALLSITVMWQFYVTAPWTRDGRVRVLVASIAPQVSGQIVEVRVVDNQRVRKGDPLYRIDGFDFQVAVTQARAEVENRAADLQVKRTQAARRESLTTLSTSVEERQQYAGTAKVAEAAYATAQAQLAQAEVNLRRTVVESPVDGYVTNLLVSVGDYARGGTTNISVVNSDTYWVDGYFEETKLGNVRIGDPVEVRLMGYAAPIPGTVDSVTRGIATSNASPGTQGLPTVDPVYTWVRLAQRVPVRIRLGPLPAGIPLVAGMTATVTVSTPLGQGGPSGAMARLRRSFLGLMGSAPAEPGGDVTTTVTATEPVASIAAPTERSPVPVDDVVPRLPMSEGPAADAGTCSASSLAARGGRPDATCTGLRDVRTR